MNTYGLLGDTRGLPTQKMLLARISKLILIPFLVVRLEPGTHKPHCDRSWITPIYSKGPWSLWNHQNGRSCTAQWCNSTLIWMSLLGLYVYVSVLFAFYLYLCVCVYVHHHRYHTEFDALVCHVHITGLPTGRREDSTSTSTQVAPRTWYLPTTTL